MPFDHERLDVYQLALNNIAVAGGAYRPNAPLSSIRPMLIKLTPEGASERASKASGVDVEYQTGDYAFDAAVYVDTPTPDPVLAVVLNADVRALVLELFAMGMTTIVVDDARGNIIARKTSFVTLHPPPLVANRMVAAFVGLARALPHVRATGGAHAKHPLSRPSIVLGTSAGILILAAIPIYRFGIVSDRYDVEEPLSELRRVGPGALGLLLGLLTAMSVVHVIKPGLRLKYAGRSDSSSEIFSYCLAIFLLVFIVVALLVAYAASQI